MNIKQLIRLTIVALTFTGVGFAAFAFADEVYVADFVTESILKFDANGNESTFASGLNQPTGLAFDSTGNLFVADAGTGNVYKFTPDGTQSTFASGLGLDTRGVAFDAAGNLFVADVDDAAVHKITPGGTVSTFASGIDPFDLAFDAAGNLYVGDRTSQVIWKYTPGGTQSVFAAATFTANGLAVDSAGNLFAASTTDGVIYEYSPDGSMQTTFASGLINPRGLQFDDAGNLFVADEGHGNVVQYTPPNNTPTIFASGLGGDGGQLAVVSSSVSPLPGRLLNISTRLKVLTGDNVLIGGFIITGTDPKKVIVRGIGPSLSPAISGVLADPVLELHEPDGTVVTNDNWKDSQEAEINATGIPPTDDLESAIVETLAPGAYTAIMSGKDGGTGVGLVEAYDLDQAADSQLANISTRGFVDIGDNVMIGGFILGGGGGGASTVIVRGIGPSLTTAGVAGALADPTLELHDGNGALIASNDDWMDGPDKQAIIDAGLAPTNPKESALLATPAPGGYTAILSGVGGTTGVGLVEAYNLQ